MGVHACACGTKKGTSTVLARSAIHDASATDASPGIPLPLKGEHDQPKTMAKPQMDPPSSSTTISTTSSKSLGNSFVSTKNSFRFKHESFKIKEEGCEDVGLVPPTIRHRKYSVPVTSSYTLEPPPGPLLSKSISRSGSPVRRRFSNVSDAVSRKISTTMGWRTVNVVDVVAQAKCLCSQYIRSRLKRAGILHKKLGLQRLRSMANLSGGWEVCQVFPRVSCIGLELERSHPKLYTSVSRQLSVTLTSEKVVRSVLASVAHHVFRGEISWARIISLFAVAAGLSLDCVKQGHPEYVAGVIEAMGAVTERHVATWVASQGGWTSLMTWSQAPENDSTMLEVLILGVGGLILAAFVLILAIKCVGQLVT